MSISPLAGSLFADKGWNRAESRIFVVGSETVRRANPPPSQVKTCRNPGIAFHILGFGSLALVFSV
jgi:hypothetical protein